MNINTPWKKIQKNKSWNYIDTNSASVETTSILGLSPEVLDRIERFKMWSEMFPDVASKLEGKLTINNKGITIITRCGDILFWLWSDEWVSSYSPEIYPKGNFTKQELCCLLLMLDGKEVRSSKEGFLKYSVEAWLPAFYFLLWVIKLEKLYYRSSTASIEHSNGMYMLQFYWDTIRVHWGSVDGDWWVFPQQD